MAGSRLSSHIFFYYTIQTKFVGYIADLIKKPLIRVVFPHQAGVFLSIPLLYSPHYSSVIVSSTMKTCIVKNLEILTRNKRCRLTYMCSCDGSFFLFVVCSKKNRFCLCRSSEVLVKVLEHKAYGERLTELWLFSLEKRRLKTLLLSTVTWKKVVARWGSSSSPR